MFSYSSWYCERPFETVIYFQYVNFPPKLVGILEKSVSQMRKNIVKQIRLCSSSELEKNLVIGYLL